MEPRPVNKWLVTAAVMIPTMIQILDTSVVNVSLNTIQGNLSANRETVTWAVTSYLVANAVVIPMSGWLARLMGRKKYLMASVVIFTLASGLCGAAASLTQLIVFRVLQGLGGGGLQPMSVAILMEAFPPRERGMAMSIFGMGAVLGPIMGPILGGYLTDHYSWRWVFYINLPIGILGLAMIYAFVFDPSYQELRKKGEPVDYLGLVLLCLGLGCLQVVADRGEQYSWFESDLVLAMLMISIICMILFVWWEGRHEQPILDLSILKDRSFFVANAVMFWGFFAFFGSSILLPLYLQGLMGYNAFLAGMVLGPGGLASLIMMPLAGKLIERLDARVLLSFGLLICAYSLFLMANFNLSIDAGAAISARVVQSVGVAFFFVPLSFLAMANIENEKMNNASAIFNLVRNMGGAYGVAFVSTLLARRTQFHQSRLTEHLTPFDPALMIRLQQLKAGLTRKLGALVDQTHLAESMIYQALQREAAVMSFCDAYYVQAVMMIGLAALSFVIPRAAQKAVRVEFDGH